MVKETNHLNRYVKRLGRTLSYDEAFVLVSEEFGYRSWFWFPMVSNDELIKIWKRQESIDKFNFRNVLPGEFILVDSNEYWDDNKINLYEFLNGRKLTWFADIFDDCDSILITSNPVRHIYHKGRHAANLSLENDIQELLTRRDTNVL